MPRKIKLTVVSILLASAAGLMSASIGAAQEGSASRGNYAPPATPISAQEHARTIEAMKPPKRKRPVVAVLANNVGAETTDFLIPYSVLTESGLADVLAVAPTADTIQLRPSIKIKPQATLDAFDERFPEGADYVIVPAMAPSPAIIAWLQAQAAKGATVMAVCAGGFTLSDAGLLKGKSATGYWLNLDQLRSQNPTMRWIPNRRFVADQGIITTTGITASMPASLALVEAIGGRTKADALAKQFGMANWHGEHDSNAFGPAERERMKVVAERRGEKPVGIGVPVSEGVDEIALAFTADAFSRPYGRLALTVASSPGPIKTKRGLTLVPDREPGSALPATMVPELGYKKPAHALDASLDKIAELWGKEVSELAALSMEYPRQTFSR
jgi:putative intracellular protease/amidase